MSKELFRLIIICWTFSICLLGLMGCGQNEDTSGIPASVDKEYSSGWKRDSTGCLKIRTPALADKLIAENHLNGKPLHEFEKVFGHANYQKTNGDQVILSYFFDCICQGGVLIEEGDKCYATFVFDADTLTEKSFVCE